MKKSDDPGRRWDRYKVVFISFPERPRFALRIFSGAYHHGP